MSSRRLFRSLLALALMASGGVYSAAQAQTQPPAAGTIEARVQACAACHGAVGQGTTNAYFPRLAGRPADYLFNQLIAFRDGRRKYPPMNYLLTYLSDDYLHEIAHYISGQRPPYQQPEHPALSDAQTARARQLVMNGDASRNIPACAACHGQNLAGMEPGIPGLIGLHSDYLSAQLGAFRSGARQALEPNCMRQVAANLSDDDVHALANWLAARTAPTVAGAAPASSAKTPLACGSEPQ